MNALARSHWTLTPLICLFSCTSSSMGAAASSPDSTPPKNSTNWRIEPSVKYDALCLLNTLSGDPFYQDYYKNTYVRYSPKLTPEAKVAVANIKRVIKDEEKGIISANLCLLFSATDDESLKSMISTVDHPEKLRANFSKTPYWDDEMWQKFDSIRGDLRVILTWYLQIGFETDWSDNTRPVAAAKAQKMLDQVSKFDVVPLIESYLGRRLESNTITIYMLTYSQPHGIKIVGTRFLTDVAWPSEIVVRNSVHEMMHPPYQLEGDKELAKVFDSFRADPFLMDKVEHHNPSFGYNTLEGFVEEDGVQAMDQRINERLGVADKAKNRWKINDDGMHVLSVALYQLMNEEKFPSKDRSFRDFLVRMNREGKLKPGSIKTFYEAMYGQEH